MLDIALAVQPVVWLAVLCVFLASGQASIFHPATVYLVFHGIVFVVRPFLVFFAGFHLVWDYMGFQPEEHDFIVTLAVTSVGLMVFVGTSLYAGRTRAQFGMRPEAALSPLQRRALLWTTLMLLPLLAASIYATRGGQESLGEAGASGTTIMTHSVGYLNDAQFAMAPLLCLWLVATRFHWLNLIPLVAYVGYRSWYGWARWTILLFFLMVVMAFCWHRRRRWLPLWSLAAALPVLLLFHVLGANRDMVKQYLKKENIEVLQRLRPGMSALEEAGARYDTLDFANFDYLAAVVAMVPKRTGNYNYGLQYSQLFTEPIPRQLWHGKPTAPPLGAMESWHRWANWMGLTVSIVGDGWTNGGWIGVVIHMALAGTILGLAHKWFWARQDKPIAALLYISGLAMIPQQYRDGGISIFKFLLVTWLPFLVWVVWVWLLGQARVPGASLVLRPGDTLRVVKSGDGRAPAREIIRRF